MHLRTCAASDERKHAAVNANTVTPLPTPRGCEATARTTAGNSGVLHMHKSTRPCGRPGTDSIFSLTLDLNCSDDINRGAVNGQSEAEGGIHAEWKMMWRMQRR